MSEEEENKRKHGAAGGGFEGGLRSTLEKAPGIVAPSWATMQSAMAGGAAGGTAAASWRWLIGPAAGAALVGGAFWLSEPSDPLPEAPEVHPVEEVALVDPQVPATGDPEVAVVVASEEMEGNSGQELEQSQFQGPVMESANQNAQPSETATNLRGMADVEGTEIPSNWAELPVEEAAAFVIETSEACVGTEISFGMDNALKDVRVLWNFGDGQFSSQNEPSHVFRAPGTYDITLSITRISDGVIRTRTIENLVTIHPIPEAEFTWEVPSTASDLPLVSLRDRSRDAASSTWIVDGESSRAGEATAFELSRVGEHVIQLVASSAHGCQSVAHHSVVVGNRFGLGGAARFSPNGDGRYDAFLPQKLLREDAAFVFRVEDDQGRIVYETTKVKAWDGMLPNGTLSRSGQEFHWTVVIQGENGPAYFSDVIQVE